jgi:RNase adapter protein RapZ
MSLLIVSGLSGSGKSIALQALEDLGYYCIDNLPAGLLPHFTEQLLSTSLHSRRKGEVGGDSAGHARRKSEVNSTAQNQSALTNNESGASLDDAPTHTAVGIDARNRAFLDVLPQSLARLEQLGVSYRIIFLEADEAVLVKRFKETRRKHPLTDKDTPLLEGIRLERKLLEPLSFNPALRIDTTHTTPHELRTRVQDFASGDDTNGMTLLFESFGYKKGTPTDADYVFDVRCLPNPHWQPELRPFTGRDPQVIAFLARHVQVQQMFDDLRGLLERWLPGFDAERRSYMTIAIGCTGGQHRSVYLVERLAAHFAGQGIKTQIRHRELA